MTIDQIYATLTSPAYLHDNTLTLPDSALGSGDIQALIDAYLPGDALVINDADIEQATTSVTVKGTGGVAPFTGMQIEATFSVSEDGSEAEVAMTATVGQGWTFAKSFPALADSFYAGMQFDSASKFYFNSYAVPDVAPPGLSFDGTLPLSGYMAALTWLFSGQTSLTVQGPIALVNQVPQMTLVAPLGQAIQIGYFEAPVQFTLSSEAINTDPPGSAPLAYTEIGLQSDIAFRTPDTAVVLPVSAAYLGSDALLVFDLDLENIISAALSELESLMNGTPLSGVLPPGWSSDFPISLTGFEIVVDPDSKQLITVTTGVATNQSWVVVPNLFAVEQVGLDFTLLDPLAQAGTSAVALGLYGQVRIGSTGVMLIEGGYPNFSLSGQLDAGTKINLKELAEYFLGSLPDVPTIEVAELEFYIDALNGEYEGSAMVVSDWTIALGSTELAIREVSFSIAYTKDGTTAMIGGELGIGSATIDVVWNLPGDIQFTGELPAISLTELIQTFSSQPLAYPLPDFQLVNSVLFIEEDFSTGNFYLALGTSVTYNNVDWGDFEIEFINTNVGTGFAFGFVLPQSWTLADLSQELASLAWLQFRNLSLIVATVDDPTFSFRSISTEAVAFPTQMPSTTQPGVQAGMQFYAELLLQGGALDTVSRLLGDSTSLRLSGVIPAKGYSYAKLTAALDGAFHLIGDYVVLNNLYLTIQLPSLIDFHVEMMFTLFGSTFTLVGDIALQGEEVDFALSTKTPWVNPFGIQGLTIVNMGVEFSLGAMITFSLGGRIYIGSGASQIDVEVGGEFNVDEEGIPDVLLVDERRTIKLADVIHTFTRASVPDDLLAIELRGFTLIIIANPLGWRDPANNKFYSFGLAFSSSLYFYGLTASFAIQVSWQTGISARGSMDVPLRIGNIVTLASATDPTKGPYFEINSATSPYLTFSAKLTMYEISSVTVNARVESGAFYFYFEYSISGLGQVRFDSYLQNKNEFAVDARAYFAIPKSQITITTAGGHRLGTLKINLSLDAYFSLHIGPGGAFLLSFGGTFNLQGYSFTISGQVTTSLSKLADLLTAYIEALAANLWTVASRILQDVTALFAFVGQGALSLTSEIASILFSELRTGLSHAVQLLKGVEHVMSWRVRDIASMIKSAYAASKTDLARALMAAGYDVESVADAIGHVFGLAYDDVAKVLKDIGYDLSQIAQALKNVFGKSANDVAKFFKDKWKIADTVVHDALSGAGYVASEIEDAMKKVFNWVSGAAHTAIHYMNPKNW
ncbi:MAG TPA: hypothetical protein VKA60_19650 [Blastocatellia bacterium]|nr:hypothetical protein [Blastocatellia bacterium]